MPFRKIAAASEGKLIRAYFTENRPEPSAAAQPLTPGRVLEPGERLTAYYTGQDSRATWRPDMPVAAARALGIDHTRMPLDAELDRLFEAKRGDTGEAWSDRKRTVSAYDFTFQPHKSVSLAAAFAKTPAERAAILNAIDRAGDRAMHYIAGELGWARKGDGGKDGAEPGAVGWVSFRHHTARPTLPIQDGRDGATYLADSPIIADPHEHIHYALFNMVVTEDGSRDTVIVVVNLDPHGTRETMVHLDMPALGLDWDSRFEVTDVVTGQTFDWGAHDYVRLDPFSEPAHVLVVRGANA